MAITDSCLIDFYFFTPKKRNMKNSFGSALRCRKKSIAIHYGIVYNLILFLCITIFTGILFTSCQKEVSGDVKSIDPLSTGSSNQISTDNNGNSQYAEVVNMYSGLSDQTIQELQQARAATARYRDIRNAIGDGYSNINVDVPNMGHHFMKTSLIDATFDIRHPEILVYNGAGYRKPCIGSCGICGTT